MIPLRAPARRLALAAAVAAATPAAAAAGQVTFEIDAAQVTPGIGEQLVLHLAPQLAQAGLGPELEAVIDAAITPALDALRTQVNAALAPLQFDVFLHAMANATAASGNIGAFDHATDPSVAAIGVTVTGAANLPDLAAIKSLGATLVDQQVPPIGAGAGLGVSLRFALASLGLPPAGPVDWDRLTVEATALMLDLVGAARAAGLSPPPGLAARSTSLGLHAQYLALPGHAALPHGLARWGGIRVGTGLHYGRLALSMAGQLPKQVQPQAFSWRGVDARLDATWSGDVRLALDLHALSVPLMISTSVQLLVVLNLYAGVAGELNAGASTLSLSGEAPVTLAVHTPDNEDLQVAAPEVRLEAHRAGRPTLADARAFVGAALDLWVVSLFVEAGLDTAHSYAVAGGARIVW